MNLKIVALPAFNDNYIWLLHHGREAVVIDPGQSAPVADYLLEHDLVLAQIWVTHYHADHTGGIADLQQAYPECRVLGAADIVAVTDQVGEGDVIAWQQWRADVWHTAGHTAQHLCFLLHDGAQSHLFCGDTLFSAGCGRVFPESRPEWLYASLQRIARLPDDVLLYPAHEYTASNLRFAAHVEPDNVHISAAQVQAACTPTLPTTLAHEKRINPFLRVHENAIRVNVATWAQDNLTSDEAVFVALRAWKNAF